jgi:metallo-beta-lactamase family protein
MSAGEPHALAGAEVTLRRAGHILGAGTVDVAWGDVRVVFSGDLGRYGDPLMVDPEPVRRADYLVVESTYGDRRHDPGDPEAVLETLVARTVRQGGTVVIPAFAVGRVQSLLLHFQRLKAAGRLPHVPIFVDSPMATSASELLQKHRAEHRLSPAECEATCSVAEYVRDVAHSKRVTATPMPKVIISASGMATGGRVLHHLKAYAPDPRSLILFTGFQAAGTRGAAMVAGADAVKIHGQYVPVRADVQNLQTLSAHADQDEIIRWLRGFERPPRMTFIAHGEPTASDALRLRIEEALGWPCRVPERLENVRLG